MFFCARSAEICGAMMKLISTLPAAAPRVRLATSLPRWWTDCVMAEASEP